MKKNILPITLFVLCMLSAVYIMYTKHANSSIAKPCNHEYDYILEIEATDSIEHVYIYDYQHNPVGDYTTAHNDSLQIIIDADNL